MTMLDLVEDLDTVPSLDDELVEHECPLHSDMEFEHLAELNAHQRRYLEIACVDLRLHEEGARSWQLTAFECVPSRDLFEAARDDARRARYYDATRQMKAALRWCERIRAEMRRVIAGDPMPVAVDVDLWARS